MAHDPDILISRVVDRLASPEDWRALESIGSADPAIWRELAMALRDDAMLRGEVREATASATRVGFPEGVFADGSLRERGRFGLRTLRISAWSGWAAAAVILLAFVSGNRERIESSGAGGGVNQAGLLMSPAAAARTLPADQLRNLYLEKGQEEGTVIGETPSWVVKHIEQSPDGGYVAVVVRQIVERHPVGELRRVATDEAGRQVSVPFVPVSAKPGPM